jgi:transmembrane sensor
MDTGLLSRILSGEASPEEKEEFYRKLGESKDDEELFYQVKSLWIKSSMYNKTIDVDSEFDILWKKIKPAVRPASRFIGQRIIRYAAMVLFILGIGGLGGYFISKNIFDVPDSGMQKYTATKGSVSIVELADGTKIWLNSGSQVSYREDHKGKQRLAELTGEAYFEVSHREDFPLLVSVGQIVVRDLGTIFNIRAYAEDKTIETSLVEGKADILNSRGKSLVELKPGESAIYSSEDKKIEIKSTELNVLSAWRDGKFVIRDQRLEDIFIELSRWYDIEFRFENQSLRDYRYTGNIKKSTTAQQVLKMLKLTTNFNYRIIEKPTEPDVIIIF